MCGEMFLADIQIRGTFNPLPHPPPIFKGRERVEVVWGGTESMGRKIRILIAKPGLDGHDRGAKVIARGFRDAGFEVIYTGLHQTPEQIVAAAIQEDVDAIGLSSLAGAHDYLFPRVIELLKEKGADDIMVFGGGIVPEEDMPALTQAGVKGIFTPGTSIEEAVKWVRENVKPRK
jgi:methylmalonyl-CoA mutase C-terminal domain/subunit